MASHTSESGRPTDMVEIRLSPDEVKEFHRLQGILDKASFALDDYIAMLMKKGGCTGSFFTARLRDDRLVVTPKQP